MKVKSTNREELQSDPQFGKSKVKENPISKLTSWISATWPSFVGYYQKPHVCPDTERLSFLLTNTRTGRETLDQIPLISSPTRPKSFPCSINPAPSTATPHLVRLPTSSSQLRPSDLTPQPISALDHGPHCSWRVPAGRHPCLLR